MLRESYYIEPTAIDEVVFTQLVPADHYLRRVKSAIDFAALRPLLAAPYTPGQGRPAEDPVRLFQLGFLQFHYNLSDREVLAAVQVNVAMRFFLDLSLHSPLPHPSSLSVFRTRLGADRYQQLFDQLLAQARAQGLVKDRLRLKDATHVLANIAIPSTIRLVAQTRQRLLDAARPFAPAQVLLEEAETLRVRTATGDLPDQERLLQRVAHLRRIVAWVEPLQTPRDPAAPAPDLAQQVLEQALAWAHKVLADRDAPEAGDKLLSLTDPDARKGKHGQYYSGYLLDLLVDGDSELITGVEVLAANSDEAADATSLVQHEEAVHTNDVQILSIDGAGFRGDLLREWTDPAGLALQVVVPPSPLPEPTAYFAPEDFVVEAASGVLTCPGGQRTTHRTRNTPDTAWKYSFTAAQCRDCPLRERCMSQPVKTTGRTVMKNDYAAEYAAARQRAAGEHYRTVRRTHRRVEGKLAEVVQQHGGRRARYRGRRRVRIQYLVLAMVINIKRMVRLLGAARAQQGATAAP